RNAPERRRDGGLGVSAADRLKAHDDVRKAQPVVPAGVELQIEALVLDGFPPGDRFRIADALQNELARLLAAHGVPPALTRPGAVERLDGGAFEIDPVSQPDTVGVQIAQTVHRSMSR